MQKMKLEANLRYSIYDGLFANVFTTLTGGIFLTGFALTLGMNEFMIGILGAMPYLVTVLQLPASYLIMKTGKRKSLTCTSAALARLIWIPILALALLPIGPASMKPGIFLVLIFLSQAFLTVSSVAWFSWTSDLVPEDFRGRFFGTRNMICGAAGMTALVVFGRLVECLNARAGAFSLSGFTVCFMFAIVFGVLSLRYLKKISEPKLSTKNGYPFRGVVALPLKEPNFRRFLLFSFFWNFSVHIAGPFFSLYFLRDLGFDYGYVALLGVVAALADLMGMHFWGRISDRFKNRPVIRLAGWITVFLPAGWALIDPQNLVIPLILQAIGGTFWAGINLCTSNMLLCLSPGKNRASFLSVFNVTAGLGAAVAPLISGLVLKEMSGAELHLFSKNLSPLQAIFIASTAMRILSLLFLGCIREPRAATTVGMIRTLCGEYGLSAVNAAKYLVRLLLPVQVTLERLPAAAENTLAFARRKRETL